MKLEKPNLTNPTPPMATDTQEIRFISPGLLTPHPLLDPLPQWADTDEQFQTLLADIHARGIDQPILINDVDQILDGRHRWRAALKLNLPAVPCLDCAAADPVPVITQSLLQRRHFTKGALAYIALPLLDASGQANPDFAADTGVSLRLIEQALELRTLFAADPDYRSQIEPLVLSGDIGLGAAIAGFAGRAATKGKARREADPAALLQRGFNDLRVRLANWDFLQPEQRKAATAIIGQFAAALPPEPLQLLVREINKSLKARKQ